MARRHRLRCVRPKPATTAAFSGPETVAKAEGTPAPAATKAAPRSAKRSAAKLKGGKAGVEVLAEVQALDVDLFNP